jgi:hypothetical protein
MTLRRLHGTLAVLLGLFLILHLGNHLAGLWGQEVHGRVQSGLRLMYRFPAAEVGLLAAFAVQAGLGLALIRRRPRLTLQTASGVWLALFLTIHVGAVLAARWQGTDTTLAFAAAGLHAPAPWPLVFAVYYGLAVMAIFAHLSVPLGRLLGKAAAHIALATGAVVASVLVLLLAGRIAPLTIPPALIAAFP